MSIIRNIRTPIMHRAVEANGFVFVGGTIADDTSASMGEQTRNILALLWQIYSRRDSLQIHFRQCGHRCGGGRAMSSRIA
jgi:hypothetical protein